MPHTRPPATPLYEIDEEIERGLRGDVPVMRMDINTIDIPKSTLIAAGALWAVIAGIGTWNLITTISIKDQQARDIKELAIDASETKGRVTSLEGRVLRLEQQ